MVVSLLAVPGLASASVSNISSGRAYDIAVKTSPLSTTVFVGPDTGLISTNGTQSTSVKLSAASASTSVAKATLLDASVATHNEFAQSKADVATFTLTLPGAPTITGQGVTAQSTTTCRTGGTSSGSSVLGSITVDDKTYSLAVPPNTTIPLGSAGTITLNEEKAITNGLLVNAVHVRTVLGSDAVVESASSAVSNCT
jgi:hypothetical protein